MATHPTASLKPRASPLRAVVRPCLLIVVPPLVLLLSLHALGARPGVPAIAPLLHSSWSSPSSSSKSSASPRFTLRGLQCVRVLRNLQSREGIGAFFKQQQLAVLLASYYNSKLAFPSVESVHGYNFKTLFSECGTEEDSAFPEKCKLIQDQLVHYVCPRADCDCLAGQLHGILQNIIDRGCPVVGIINDGYKRQEFSGCLTILQRYFGTQGPPPDWEYDAVHYRQGDLAKPGGGGKVFRDMDFYLIIKEMCKLSDRDIVIVTEGSPPVPECGNRIILADTTIQHAMQIFQHAKQVSVGVSSFAHILLEMGKPERMIMLLTNVMRFEWVDCEMWTLIDKQTGATFHFDSKKGMMEIISSVRDLRIERKATSPDKLEKIQFNMTVPKRKWTPELMKPAIVRG